MDLNGPVNWGSYYEHCCNSHFPPLSSVDLLPSSSPQGSPPLPLHIISPVLRDKKCCVLEFCHKTDSETFVFLFFLSRTDSALTTYLAIEKRIYHCEFFLYVFAFLHFSMKQKKRLSDFQGLTGFKPTETCHNYSFWKRLVTKCIFSIEATNKKIELFIQNALIAT